MHGGVERAALGQVDVAAVSRGVANLLRHVENVKKFGVPVVVALNRFTGDTADEIAAVQAALAPLGVRVVLCMHWADGAAGAADLAREVAALIAGGTADFRPLYPAELPLAEKLRTIARQIYRAADVTFAAGVERRLDAFERAGFGGAPVCVAKTQYSFSADPTLRGAPEGHLLPVREVRLSAGAGFVVALAGDVMTMPGLPRIPAAEAIGLGPDGAIEGLF
jgi:formate--tetrahydrofolate ligase